MPPEAITDRKRVALVTGASQGIGRAIALRLAADGLDVALNDIPANNAALEAACAAAAAHGARAVPLTADVTDEAQVAGLVARTVEALGALDVLVANAGIITSDNIVDMPVEEFERIFAVNVRGTFLCYKHAARQMIAQGRGGRIVGAASMLGKRASRNTAAYSASKFAVRGLTQSAALELGAHGITVNAYAPGAIQTPMMDFMEARNVSRGVAPGAFTERMSTASAVGEMGAPADIANVVSFLVSEKSHFITGQSVSVDGGVILT